MQHNPSCDMTSFDVFLSHLKIPPVKGVDDTVLLLLSKFWNGQLRLETGTALETLSCKCLDVVNKQKNRIVNGRIISNGNFLAEFKYPVKHIIHVTINSSLNTVYYNCIFVMLIRVFVLRWRWRVYLESILFKVISTV